MDVPASTRPWRPPPLIQGGMGVAVSGWALAAAVARLGHLGVVSGTALETVHARRLADGDQDGQLRRAYATFPVPAVAERVLARWHRPQGRAPGEPYANVPSFSLDPPADLVELTVVAAYAEVWLARQGHDGLVGINLLEKVQPPTPFVLYGAMLAGVDVVLMGAGIPRGIPRLLRALAAGGPVRHPVHVHGWPPAGTSSAADEPAVHLDPPSRFGTGRLPCPRFLAIVSSHTLAGFLARDPATRPDGFVIEHHSAGGHNAPPRRSSAPHPAGEPVYGARDEADLDAVAALGTPFWLAGSYGSPERVAEARALGATGVQVGSAFACCEESGLAPHLKQQLVAAARDGRLVVRTDGRASPTGFPFKVAELPGTLSDPEVHRERTRVCDLGYLRTLHLDEDGTIRYRCPGEPVAAYRRKGGDEADTVGRVCLCNGLLAAAGLPQVRATGAEPPVVTAGEDLARVLSVLAGPTGTYRAADVVRYLLPDEGDEPPAPRPAGAPS